MKGNKQYIVLGGLSGTGKSTVAKAIQAALQEEGQPTIAIEWLRTDAIRKDLAGIPHDITLPPTAYTQERSTQVYAELFRLARASKANIILLDGVFLREAERTAAESLGRRPGGAISGSSNSLRATPTTSNAAHAASITATCIWLHAAPAVVRERLGSRRGDVSDANTAVYEQQLAHMAEQNITWPLIDTGNPPDVVARQILSLSGR